MKDDAKRRGKSSTGRLPPGSLERNISAPREWGAAELPAMTTPPADFAVPAVAYTPSGAEELRAFRRKMARQTGLSWLIPIGSLLASVFFAAVGLQGLAGLLIIAAAVTVMFAPGLTAVFMIRRLKAGRQMMQLPQLPAARLRLGKGRSSGET